MEQTSRRDDSGKKPKLWRSEYTMAAAAAGTVVLYGTLGALGLDKGWESAASAAVMLYMPAAAAGAIAYRPLWERVAEMKKEASEEFRTRIDFRAAMAPAGLTALALIWANALGASAEPWWAMTAIAAVVGFGTAKLVLIRIDGKADLDAYLGK